MSHFSDGELQARLDGEIRPDDGREMERHLQSCPECMAAMDRLDTAGRVTASALSELDTLPGVDARLDEAEERMRAIRRRATARQGRRRSRRLLAASVILVLGVSVAFPASPLRAWFVRAWEQVVLVFDGPGNEPARPQGADSASGSTEGALPQPSTEPRPEDASAPAEEAGLHADASALPVQILLHDLLPGTEIEVVFVEGTQAGVFAPVASRFRSGPGRLEAVVRGERVRVEVPRLADNILLLADGQPLLEKYGDSLSVRGPVRERDADRIRFVIPDA